MSTEGHSSAEDAAVALLLALHKIDEEGSAICCTCHSRGSSNVAYCKRGCRAAGVAMAVAGAPPSVALPDNSDAISSDKLLQKDRESIFTPHSWPADVVVQLHGCGVYSDRALWEQHSLGYR